jgi:hypothetical protein
MQISKEIFDNICLKTSKRIETFLTGMEDDIKEMVTKPMRRLVDIPEDQRIDAIQAAQEHLAWIRVM